MVDVTIADADDLDRWNDYVSRSPQGTFFHEYETLQVLADHSGASLHPLIGYKGQEPVGLFPVFALRKGPVTTAFSPPPHLRVPALGPAFLNMSKLKQRKREKRRERLLEGCFEWIDDALAPRYASLRTAPGFPDSRPFRWHDYEVTPEYTYRVDVTPEPDDLLDSFSSDARRNVTNTREDAYEIEAGDVDAIHAIVEQVRRRYESQGLDFDVPLEFVVDLHDRSPTGEIRPYVCRVDDEFVGGILAVEHGDTIGRWMGGVRTDREIDVPTNDLLDWAVMADAHERGLETYDLVGGDNQRINRYKAKFNPDLERYYSIERGSWGMRTLAHLYNSVK